MILHTLMQFITTDIQGVTLIKPRRYVDARGYFTETFNQKIFEEHCCQINFVQDNESLSTRGVLRGLHLQSGDFSQAKLVRVVTGRVFDVVVDVRPHSTTFGKWFGTELSEDNGLMLFVPRGFAHGFLVMSDNARFVYKVDNYYAPQSELTIRFDDAELDIRWPEMPDGYILSEKDRDRALTWREYVKLIFETR